jgi:hypothetical protein
MRDKTRYLNEGGLKIEGGYHSLFSFVQSRTYVALRFSKDDNRTPGKDFSSLVHVSEDYHITGMNNSLTGSNIPFYHFTGAFNRRS